MTQYLTGTVKWYSKAKGFGFIIPDDGSQDLFVHRSSIMDRIKMLHDGEKVTYTLGQGDKGPTAQNVSGENHHNT